MKVFLGAYPFPQEVRLSLETVVNGTIQLSYKGTALEDTQMVDEADEAAQGQLVRSKPRKVKERTICEAIEAVKQWRTLYDSSDETGKRIYTLEDAAKCVGIAKKTLDDYHVHLRVAYQFNFNLERFKEKKVGILRKYVKLAREQGMNGLQSHMPECILDCDTDKYWVDFDNL